MNLTTGGKTTQKIQFHLRPNTISLRILHLQSHSGIHLKAKTLKKFWIACYLIASGLVFLFWNNCRLLQHKSKQVLILTSV